MLRHALSGGAVVLAALGFASGATAQSAPAQSPSSPPVAPTTFTVTVVGTTPLAGVELPPERIPAPVQSLTAQDLQSSGALDVADYLSRRLNGVHVNETQGNPFQPDLSYRGYTASPLLGTPQGLSIYMDGVRMNQPFGEVVSWDLIPRVAIFSSALMPGSNPMFGLNTLGGALSIQTKDGLNSAGTVMQATYGSDLRRAIEFEHGGSRSSGFDWYVAANLFAEDGWRDDSPSAVRQLFGKLGWRRARADATLTVVHADNVLNGNGLQEFGFLERDFGSVYTKPDETDNRSTLLNLVARRDLGRGITMSANAYYRHIGSRTFNGDINEDSLDQSIYKAGVESPAGTPFPSLRCLDNVALNDEPGELCNGLINRTRSIQHNGGAAAQVTRRHTLKRAANQITLGGGYDRSGVSFTQTSELGYLAPDRSVVGTGAFADGVTGGEIDGEPFDTRVALDGVVRTWSLYATDTLSLGTRWHATLSGRFNSTEVDNRDQILPGGGPGSLDGIHTFSRFNPAVGVTFIPNASLNVYAGYSEGSRAATSIELGCADPEQPCKLPNAMAGDPPLQQVVTRTVETGVRGNRRGVNWHAGFFHALNNDDILFVTSEQTGFGYFRNFGKTRRQGIELGVHGDAGRVSLGAGYTFLDATFQSEETVNGESNSTNSAAVDGEPGLEGSIDVVPGDRMPYAPRHVLKVFAGVRVTDALGVDVDLSGISSSYARGNENNEHEPDGVHYLGRGSTPGYVVVNLGARYTLTRWLQVIGQVNNLFDRRYYTAAQLGPLGFTANGSFVARPFPAADGEFPLRHSTFYAPGAPIRGWIGTRLTF